MSAWVLIVQPQAERDMLEIGERIAAAAGEAVALKWILAFERSILNLCDNPHIGAESDFLGKGRRRLVLRPYLIVYRVEAPYTVRIIRVVDGRQDLPAVFANVED
jgi:plasmid stabilization system protein ParE